LTIKSYKVVTKIIEYLVWGLLNAHDDEKIKYEKYKKDGSSKDLGTIQQLNRQSFMRKNKRKITKCMNYLLLNHCYILQMNNNKLIIKHNENNIIGTTSYA